MDRPPLKVSFPSEISAAFCAVLAENDIGYSSGIKPVRPGDGSFDFIVNSAEDLKEIAIAVIESKPFWSAVAAAIWAFARRHKHKVIYVEKDGYKFKASGMSQEELSRTLKDATNLIITERDLQD
ncbi:hypothetical protein BI322_03870 [Klebsiella oxytoca]|nr:hypothetical protein BI322_03870 [Klebsiella oxytoca]